MKKVKIYLGGGWFNDKQKEIIDFIETSIFNYPSLQVFSPRRETSIKEGTVPTSGEKKRVFTDNLNAISNSDLMIASTEGKDMGTLFECGYAYANNIPIIYVYFTDNPLGFNLMLSQSSIGVITNKSNFKELLNLIEINGVKDGLFTRFEYTGKIE